MQDGERGDADLTADGTIVDPGGPVVSVAEPDSGSLGTHLLLSFGFILLLSRCRRARVLRRPLERSA